MNQLSKSAQWINSVNEKLVIHWANDSLSYWFTKLLIRWTTDSLNYWCTEPLMYCATDLLNYWFSKPIHLATYSPSSKRVTEILTCLKPQTNEGRDTVDQNIQNNSSSNRFNEISLDAITSSPPEDLNQSDNSFSSFNPKYGLIFLIKLTNGLNFCLPNWYFGNLISFWKQPKVFQKIWNCPLRLKKHVLLGDN